jgi:hypothetical protein
MFSFLKHLFERTRNRRTEEDRYERNLNQLAQKEAELEVLQQHIRQIQVSTDARRKTYRTLSKPTMLAVVPAAASGVDHVGQRDSFESSAGFYRLKLPSESEE